VRYQGNPVIFTDDDLKLLAQLERLRLDMWKARGKNKIHAKRETGQDMNALIQTLQKQLDKKDEQLGKKDEQLQSKDEQIASLMLMMNRIACGDTVSADEAKRHLSLVPKK
jgi:uncharacterized protein (DUF3084 family)